MLSSSGKASCLLIHNYLDKDFRIYNYFMLALLSHSIDLIIAFRKYSWDLFSLKASFVFFLQSTRFEDQIVFTVKSRKPSEHHGYCMTASLQQEKELGRGHGSRLQYGQRNWSNWVGGRKAQGAGQCPRTPQEPAGSQEQAQMNFFTCVNKQFSTQTWSLVPIAPLPLHHTQWHVLCPGQGQIFPGTWAGTSHHTQLPQPPQGYRQGGFLYHRSHWNSNSRNRVRANSFNWYVYGTVMMTVKQK